jgi:SAM-dependent methyltransferase
MQGIEPFLEEARDFVSARAPELLPLFDVFAKEASFARHWLSPSLSRLPAGASILEVGAGLMLVSCQLAREGFAITALEPIGEGFEAFTQLQTLILAFAGEHGCLPDVRTMPVESLADAGPFEFAFSVNVMEHVADVTAAIGAVHAALCPGSHYRFTCPNYLFPYEPHFNIPTVFSKRLTARLWWKRIVGHPEAPNPEGLWQSLNWITVPAIARACRRLAGARAVFDTNIGADAFERVIADPIFAARRPAWLRAIAHGLVATRLHRVLALLPAFMQPLIDCQIERAGSLAKAAQGTSG